MISGTTQKLLGVWHWEISCGVSISALEANIADLLNFVMTWIAASTLKIRRANMTMKESQCSRLVFVGLVSIVVSFRDLTF